MHIVDVSDSCADEYQNNLPRKDADEGERIGLPFHPRDATDVIERVEGDDGTHPKQEIYTKALVLDRAIGGLDDGISSREQFDQIAHEISRPEEGDDGADASAEKARRGGQNDAWSQTKGLGKGHSASQGQYGRRNEDDWF